MSEAKQLDVVVRFYDMKQFAELERCIFSLLGQEYRPLHINLVVPRFSDHEVALLRSMLDPLLLTKQPVSIKILNWEHDTPVDARSALMNFGIQEAKGRYLSFLNYSDVLYPEAYLLLIEKLEAGKADIAFAKARIVELQTYGAFFRPSRVLPSLGGEGLVDLFRENYCFDHIYLIDRKRIPDQFLFFEPYLVIEEGYDFVLRICAQFLSDFSLIRTEIGDSYLRSDMGDRDEAKHRSPDWSVRHERSLSFIEQRRRSTPLSAQVQRTLGISVGQHDLSIRDFIGPTL